MQLRKITPDLEMHPNGKINTFLLKLIERCESDLLIISIGSRGNDRQQQLPNFALEYSKDHKVEIINIDPSYSGTETGSFKVLDMDTQFSESQVNNLLLHYSSSYFLRTLNSTNLIHKPFKKEINQMLDLNEFQTLNELLLNKLKNSDNFRIIIMDNMIRDLNIPIALIAINLIEFIGKRVEVISGYYQNSDCLIYSKDYFSQFNTHYQNHKEYLLHEEALRQKVLQCDKWDFQLKLQLLSLSNLLENSFWQKELLSDNEFKDDYKKLISLHERDTFSKFEFICKFIRWKYYGEFKDQSDVGCQGTQLTDWDISKFKELAMENFLNKNGMHVVCLATIMPHLLFRGSGELSSEEFQIELDKQISNFQSANNYQRQINGYEVSENVNNNNNNNNNSL